MPSEPAIPSPTIPPLASSLRRGKTWLAVALFASVLLNLFLAGVVTGRLAGAGPVRDMLATSSTASVGRELMQERFRALPLADRLRFLRALAEHRDTLRAAAATLTQARL